MRLKSLDIHGFKSFADKTKLEFHEGVTGIVGPNGCGKSNIVDAMRWVLGETSAKALRGGEMADVIFNGTDRRSALGMAEVTLTLSGCSGVLDTEYDEVSIGRRVFRDGKGEYLINKQPCRLKDVHSLFMDTGIGRSSYSIMEQGKIDMLLSSKPEDRRAVFEEAAGITKYKSQKKEALRKLDYTEANLVRIRDVIAENERQIRSLSRQASKAKRYQSLFSDVRTLELHLNHKQWRELRAERSELRTSMHVLRMEQDALEDAIEKRQAQMAGARVEYQEIEARLVELRRQLARWENEISTATNRIEFNGERAHELSVLIRKNEGAITEAGEKATRQENEIAAADRQLAEVLERIAKREAEVAEIENAWHELRGERERWTLRMRELEEERSNLKSRVASLAATIETNEGQRLSDQQRLRQLDDESARLREDEVSRRGDAEELKARISENERETGEFELTLTEMEQKYHRAKRAAVEMQEALGGLHQLHAEKRSRLEVLEQLLVGGEGYGKGTRAVLQDLGDRDGLRGAIREPLARYLEVDAADADAIEAALGRQLQAVVVADLEVAGEIVEALREGRLGRASLIAETSLRQAQEQGVVPEAGETPLGALAWAIDRVRCRPEVEPLVRSLLRKVLVAEDLETALRLRALHPDVAVTTLDGTFVTDQGVVQGGVSGDESASALKMQSEIAELRRLTEALSQEVGARQLRRDALNERVDQLEDALQVARERLQQKRVSSSTLEGRLALIERDLNQLGNKLESLQWERDEVSERQTRLDSVLAGNQAEREEKLAVLATLEEESESVFTALGEARGREDELNETLTGARTSLAVEQGTMRNLEEQRSPMVARLAELQETGRRAAADIETYQERIARGAEETEALLLQIQAWEAECAQAREEEAALATERQNYSARIEEGETELAAKRREVQEVASRRGREEVKSSQLDLTLENIERNCRDRYRTELEFFEPDSHALMLAIEERKANGAVGSLRGPAPERTISASGPAREASRDECNALGSDEGEDAGAISDESSAEVEEDLLDDPAEPDWDFVEDVVSQLRTKLDSMGPVNVDAIEEFDELEEHHRFNVQQAEDLENSREELLRMIARINRDTRRTFSQTFEQIRKNFRDMFKELFGEQAKADLVLLDDSDPLECGIDIIAKPPGKKLQSISLLSGGERSMTAVALLFGIYMVKPSPFCVLDELDAPLDEANITRFIRVLDRFIGDSQFVIVTHSKRTMSRADVIYGVSMEEFGVSKTVGVTFSKADEAKGLKTAAVGG